MSLIRLATLMALAACGEPAEVLDTPPPEPEAKPEPAWSIERDPERTWVRFTPSGLPDEVASLELALLSPGEHTEATHHYTDLRLLPDGHLVDMQLPNGAWDYQLTAVLEDGSVHTGLGSARLQGRALHQGVTMAGGCWLRVTPQLSEARPWDHLVLVGSAEEQVETLEFSAPGDKQTVLAGPLPFGTWQVSATATLRGDTVFTGQLDALEVAPGCGYGAKELQLELVLPLTAVEGLPPGLRSLLWSLEGPRPTGLPWVGHPWRYDLEPSSETLTRTTDDSSPVIEAAPSFFTDPDQAYVLPGGALLEPTLSRAGVFTDPAGRAEVRFKTSIYSDPFPRAPGCWTSTRTGSRTSPSRWRSTSRSRSPSWTSCLRAHPRCSTASAR